MRWRAPRFWRWRIAKRGARVSVEGRLWLHGSGTVEVGDGTRLAGGATGIELNPGRAGRITIGHGCYIGEGVSIEACELVQIGDRVVVGPWAKVLDSHFHPLTGNRHAPAPSRPVVIEDDVVIGTGAVILPGVTVRKGARIAHGAVVSRAVAEATLVAGNPARRTLTS